MHLCSRLTKGKHVASQINGLPGIADAGDTFFNLWDLHSWFPACHFFHTFLGVQIAQRAPNTEALLQLVGFEKLWNFFAASWAQTSLTEGNQFLVKVILSSSVSNSATTAKWNLNYHSYYFSGIWDGKKDFFAVGRIRTYAPRGKLISSQSP